MTTLTETEKFWGVDSFNAFAFPLNADGSLKATSTAVYEGEEIDGTRDFNLTPAEGSVVANVGNGRLRDTIYRAPREASRAELVIGFVNPRVKALLSGVNTYNVGEAILSGRMTNKQGSEPDVALIVTQRGHNDNGLTRFKSYLIPKGRIIPRDSPMTENALAETYQVTISNTKKQIWGKPYSTSEHGFTDATYEELVSEYPVAVVAWQGDGVEDEFLLPTDKPAISTAKMTVFNWDTGLQYVTGITKTVTKITLGYPSTGLIVCMYEHAE